MEIGDVEFVIAFNEDDAAALLFPSAPGEEFLAVGVFVAGHGDPQFKDVTEEDDVVIAGRDGLEHGAEIVCAGIVGVDVGVGDKDDHAG